MKLSRSPSHLFVSKRRQNRIQRNNNKFTVDVGSHNKFWVSLWRMLLACGEKLYPVCSTAFKALKCGTNLPKKAPLWLHCFSFSFPQVFDTPVCPWGKSLHVSSLLPLRRLESRSDSWCTDSTEKSVACFAKCGPWEEQLCQKSSGDPRDHSRALSENKDVIS